MHVNITGKKIRLLRSKYLKDKKRCTQILVATFDRHLNRIPEDVLPKLSEEEQKTVQNWLDDRKAKREETDLKNFVSTLPSILDRAAKGVELYGADNKQVAAIYSSIDNLTKTLRKAGFKRPKKKEN